MRTKEVFEPFIGGEVEMRTEGRPDWRCEVTKFLVNSSWLVAYVAWLAMNGGKNGTEKWKKFQHPEFIVSFSDYSSPELIEPGESGGRRLLLRHHTLDRVVLFHPPGGEKLDPTIVALIKATFIPHSDPPRLM